MFETWRIRSAAQEQLMRLAAMEACTAALAFAADQAAPLDAFRLNETAAACD